MIESSAKSIANAPTKGKREFSQEFLKECFDYKPDTGELFWRKRPDHHFKSVFDAVRWNARLAGNSVGHKSYTNGRRRYVAFYLNNSSQLAHRIIWTLVNGPIGDCMQIDHINGDTWDNRISNLRIATPSQNAQNKGVSISRKHPLPKGVLKMRKRFGARIRTQKGERIYLGTFDTAEEAAIIYQRAAQKHHGEFMTIKRSPLPN